MNQLPAPIAAYVEAANAHDPARVAACFQPDATVRDEGRSHHGCEAIAAWAAETGTRYAPTITPDAIAHADGLYRLQAEVSGNFPGSPASLAFRFALGADGIVSLEIGA